MIFYIVISFGVMGLVGTVLYREGLTWSLIFMESKAKAISVNKILLTLYYLFNAGFILISVLQWNYQVEQLPYIFSRVGLATFCIGILHFFNMTVLVKIYFKHK